MKNHIPSNGDKPNCSAGKAALLHSQETARERSDRAHFRPVTNQSIAQAAISPQAPSECKLIQSVGTAQTNVREHLTSQRIKNARVPRHITPNRPGRGVPATARNKPKPPRGGAQRELKKKRGGREFCAKRRNLKQPPQSPCIFEKKYYNNN